MSPPTPRNRSHPAPPPTDPVLHQAQDQPQRSRNARAQARHRAKRKAYIEQLEETVSKLQAALSLSPEQAAALPPVHTHANVAARLRVLEADYDTLRAFAEQVCHMLESHGTSAPPLPLPTPAPAPGPLTMQAPPMLNLGSGGPAPGSASFGCAGGGASAARTYSTPVPYHPSHPAHPTHSSHQTQSTHGAYRDHGISEPSGTGVKRRRHSGSAGSGHTGESDTSGVYVTSPSGTPPQNNFSGRPPPLTLPTSHSPPTPSLQSAHSSQPQSAHPHSAHSNLHTPPLPKWERAEELTFSTQGTYSTNNLYGSPTSNQPPAQQESIQPGSNGSAIAGAMSNMPPPMPMRPASMGAGGTGLQLPPPVPSHLQRSYSHAGYNSHISSHAQVHAHTQPLSHNHAQAQTSHTPALAQGQPAGHGYVSGNGHSHGQGRASYEMELVKTEENAEEFGRAVHHQNANGNSMHSISPTSATGASPVMSFHTPHQNQQAPSSQRPSVHQHTAYSTQYQQQPSPHLPYSSITQQQQPPFRAPSTGTMASGHGLSHYTGDPQASARSVHQTPAYQSHGSGNGNGTGSQAGLTTHAQWAQATAAASADAGAGMSGYHR